MRQNPDTLYALPSPRQLGTYLKSLRKARGLTQADLGNMMGVSPARISQIETDPSGIGFRHLLRIAHLLGARLMLDVKEQQRDTDAARKAATRGEW